MPSSPRPDPIDTSGAYHGARAQRDDWDATSATEGGARSDGRGSTIFSDRAEPPLMADSPLRRGRLVQAWQRVVDRLRALVDRRGA